MNATPDWDSLGFAFLPTDWMYRAEADAERDPAWDAGRYVPFGDVSLSPAAAVLSYGCGCFEGMKAQRGMDGHVRLFRPDAHGERLARSALRLALPPFPVAGFVAMAAGLARRNDRFVPPAGKGTLYLRPMMHGTEPLLGARRPRLAGMIAYASPVGDSFGGDRGLRLKVMGTARAADGGTGGAKAMGNYAGVLLHKEAAVREGFDDLLFLDGSGRTQLGEASGANLFCVLDDGTVATPPLDDTILPGITRDSVMRVVREVLDLPTEQRPLTLAEVRARAREVFCTGTGWTVRSVAALGGDGWECPLGPPQVASRVAEVLAGIRSGTRPDPFGWTVNVRAFEDPKMEAT
jgi:branched-chain amino acid aminotransferase